MRQKDKCVETILHDNYLTFGFISTTFKVKDLKKMSKKGFAPK